ncbi:hypothetical protein UFOVP9_51 [uncultured Caudovirales phage]|jgi:hypothetical protein|uniref:Uncharacterized protein n=1 Tax=uncultured Caudovirales phage TaxID=2100421 RepID=A0A6J5KIE6_9CAUD|nr:hypothetical protein UFOVP9_51 [uncultured Caudovirales phage]
MDEHFLLAMPSNMPIGEGNKIHLEHTNQTRSMVLRLEQRINDLEEQIVKLKVQYGIKSSKA